MLKETGLPDNFSNEAAVTNLNEKYLDFWKTKLYDDIRKGDHGNKLRTYRTFKMVYELEPYLRTVNNLDERKCLSRFRLSNHKLEIEVGRHKRKPVDERLCTVCHVVEDEIHFLIDCKKYDDARNSLFVHIQTIVTI